MTSIGKISQHMGPTNVQAQCTSRPSCCKYKYMGSQFRKNTLCTMTLSTSKILSYLPGANCSHIYTCMYNKWTHRKPTSAFQSTTSQQPYLMIFFFHLHCMSHLDFNKLRIIMKKHPKIMVFQHDQKNMCTHSGETECFPQKRLRKLNIHIKDVINSKFA